MTVQILPVIGTSQKVYDYLGISGVQAGEPLPNTSTLLSAYINQLLGVTATLICTWLDYDFTTNQVQNVNGFGNNFSNWQFPFPIASITAALDWDPLSPLAGPTMGPSNLTILTQNKSIIYRNDGGLFNENLYYSFVFTQDIGTVYGVWPLDIVQVQVEMIATIYKESANFAPNTAFPNSYIAGANSITLGIETFTQDLIGNVKFQEMTPRWKDRLRSHRRMSI